MARYIPCGKLPLWLIMRLARNWSLKEYPDGQYAESDAEFFWEVPLRELSVPFLTLYREDVSEEEKIGDESYLIDDHLRSQLDGLRAHAGLRVEWAGEFYIVAGLGTDEKPKPGSIIDAKTIRFLHLISEEIMMN